MCRFLETISVKDGKILNISDHQERMNRSIYHFYGIREAPCLLSSLVIPKQANNGWFKCRVLYGLEINEISWKPYRVRTLNSLSLVHANYIDYDWKYADRSGLEELVRKAQTDDVIIVKNGYITDGSYANLIFRKNDQWYTPDTPLLAGTQRQRCLEAGVIREATIRVEDLKNYDRIKWINALLDMETGPDWPVKEIIWNLPKAGF